MPREEVAVKVDGLADLRRIMRNTDREALKGVQRVLKDAAGIVAVEAASLAPRRTGRLAASIRPYTSGNRAGVRSRLPYAGVVHWGGTIRPKGAPITFQGTEFISRAMDAKADAVARKVADGLDDSIRAAGWH